MSEPLRYVSAILLAAADPAGLAAFYREVLGVPLELSTHEREHEHYECMLGELHFAIHPAEHSVAGGAVDLAFHVFDLHALVAELEAKGVAIEIPPEDRGFAWLAAIRDPAGNRIWLSQLSKRMLMGLKGFREAGADVLGEAQRRGLLA